MISRLSLCLALLAGAAPCAAAPFAPDGDARLTGERQEAMSKIALPVGAWSGGVMPTETVTGAVIQRAWRLPGVTATPLQLVATLRARLADAGFRTVFECTDFDCGGFDFRYATDLLPEPAMHVDLGDYLWLTARRDSGDEIVAVMASRSGSAGFIHITQVGPPKAAAQAVTLSSKSPTDPLLNTLVSQGSATLEGLEFGTGAAQLEAGDLTRLEGLCAWLKANPDRRLRLVGHTDSQGRLDRNIALSEARAAAVRDLLISKFNVDPQQLVVQGVGPNAPRADNATAEGRRLNRRVEAVLD